MPIDTELHVAAGTLEQAVRRSDVDAIAIPVRRTAEEPQADLSVFDDATRGEIFRLIEHGDVRDTAAQVFVVPADLGSGLVRLLLVGVGDGSPAELRAAGAELARRASGRTTLVTSVAEQADRAGAQAFAEGVLLASYTFTRASTPPSEPLRVHAFADAAGIAAGILVARATALARDLTNTPSSEKTPAWLAEQARGIADEHGLAVRVWDADALRRDGFGGILGVGMGSVHPPRLVELTYEPDAPDGHVVLVGKGITYDSGGLSLKPAAGMQTMKTDMAGGATVLAVLGALARLGVRHKVTGLVAIAENMPSGSALRPSDVITHYGGRTVEVLNTDAEGRLVLADALAYADARLDADVVVDIATLTGAAKIALGLSTAAVYCADDTLAGQLADAARTSGEEVWRMPLVDEYRAALDSPIADLSNVATSPVNGPAGSIEAALFLREFVGAQPWIHLDVAGPARSGADRAELTKGATGYGTRLLLAWLAAR